MPTDTFARMFASKANQSVPAAFKTNASVATNLIAPDIDYIRTSGFTAAGDLGGALYKRVVTQPSHAGKFQSADGAWWEIAEQTINPRMFGAKFDGVTDDTVAINNAITALVAISGSFTPAASYTLAFPPGRAITQGGHVIPSGIKVRVIGAGANTTILFMKNGANTFLFDIQGQYSTIEHLSLNGNRDNNPSGLECLRINAAYVLVDRVFITDAGGDGIVMGNAASAIASRMRNVDVRYCKGYGVNVSGSFASTDCQFTDVTIGTSGKSGFNIASPAQKLVNCHAWGNGIEDASGNDNHGIRMVSGASMLVGCEAETNMGRGIYIGSGIKGISIVGGTIWANAANGIYAFGASHCVFSGISIRNNGSVNSVGSSSSAFANAFLDNCTFMITAGCDMYDDGSAIPAITYRNTPPFPFLGRGATVFTVSRHYAEGTGSNNNIVTGNQLPAAQSRGGVAIVNVGALNRYSGNVTGETALPTLASAATIVLPANNDLIQITGTTAITSIAAACAGRRVTLVFAAAGCVVTAGTNLLIGTSYTSTAGSSLSLICDGTNWYRG